MLPGDLTCVTDHLQAVSRLKQDRGRPPRWDDAVPPAQTRESGSTSKRGCYRLPLLAAASGRQRGFLEEELLG